MEGNNKCADCGDPFPEWASINLGIFICIQCAGVHRSLGTHISQVRSLTLDQWDSDVVQFMRETGNVIVNEAHKLSVKDLEALYPKADVHTRTRFINAKYVHK